MRTNSEVPDQTTTAIFSTGGHLGSAKTFSFPLLPWTSNTRLLV